VIGTDDMCGAPRKASVTGTILLNADATASLRATVAPPDGGRSMELSATVSTSNGSGTWSDAFGQSGAFALGGAMTALPVRPTSAMLIDVADNPKSATDPCSVAGGRQELVLCGSTTNAYWTHFGRPPQVWRDDGGRVHIRGSIGRTASVGSGSLVVLLPKEFRPKQTLKVFATAYQGDFSGTPVPLDIYGSDNPPRDGWILVAVGAANYSLLDFGEIVFTVDR
jgi:hypothetical protein